LGFLFLHFRISFFLTYFRSLEGCGLVEDFAAATGDRRKRRGLGEGRDGRQEVYQGQEPAISGHADGQRLLDVLLTSD